MNRAACAHCLGQLNHIILSPASGTPESSYPSLTAARLEESCYEESLKGEQGRQILDGQTAHCDSLNAYFISSLKLGLLSSCGE
jgi:hypothetical protein